MMRSLRARTCFARPGESKVAEIEILNPKLEHFIKKNRQLTDSTAVGSFITIITRVAGLLADYLDCF